DSGRSTGDCRPRGQRCGPGRRGAGARRGGCGCAHKQDITWKCRQPDCKYGALAHLCAIILVMDAVDRRIIAELQRDGRLSNVELADRIGLTPAPCLRRVKRLESDGVILGYTARINPQAIGRGFEVLVNIDLTRKDRATFEAFEAAVAALDEVIEVRRMFGLPDYLLRVTTA